MKVSKNVVIGLVVLSVVVLAGAAWAYTSGGSDEPLVEERGMPDSSTPVEVATETATTATTETTEAVVVPVSTETATVAPTTGETTATATATTTTAPATTTTTP